jgi:hypothetical protein
MLNALGALAKGGFLYIYQGTQPASGGGSATGSTVLVMFNLQNPAFGQAASGSIGAVLPPAAVATAAGTAQWFRMLASDNATVLLDGSVGTSGCDLNLANTTIASGDTISITSFTITQPEQ